ncbi:10 kDa heat shock protein, mitochondrial-like [Artemia franciscana]|uniref:10 kDa heat shock protein, mitochondrial-like n=1 Tax=Artemia franciscana TaxID=6661 RepID=UPI0032DB0707
MGQYGDLDKLDSAQADLMRNGSFWTPFLGLLVECKRADVGLWVERLISATMENITMKTERDKSGALKRLVPLSDHILVEKAEPITKAWGDIVIQQKVVQATVVAVGPGAINNQGPHRPVMVKVGDTVLLPEYGGTKVEIKDKEYFLLKENDLLAKLES